MLTAMTVRLVPGKLDGGKVLIADAEGIGYGEQRTEKASLLKKRTITTMGQRLVSWADVRAYKLSLPPRIAMGTTTVQPRSVDFTIYTADRILHFHLKGTTPDAVETALGEWLAPLPRP